MSSISDENSDVDSAGVYFVTVEKFEQCEVIDVKPKWLVGEQPARTR